MGAVPGLFVGESAIIDSICIFVLTLISHFSLKYYRIKKNRNYLFLAVAFILLIVSFLLKIFISFGVDYNVMGMGLLGYGSINPENLTSLESGVFLIYFFYHLTLLIGLYLFYAVYDKQSKSNMILAVYLIVLLSYFSHSNPAVFHFSAFMILFLATMLCVNRYISKKYPATMLLILGVAVITASQALFTFVERNEKIYLIAEVVQLVGYLTLLLTFIAVLIYGRKKNKDGYYW